jgi:gluconolactonase
MTRCTPDNVQLICQGLDHPEGLNFAPDGSLIAGGEAGQIYRVDCAKGTSETIARTDGFVLGVCLDAAGNVYACDAGRREVLKVSAAGQVDVYSSGTSDHKLTNPNYCAFDRAGNLFYTDSGDYHPSKCNGKLFVVTPGQQTRCIHPGPLWFANGICIDPEESLLYLVQSTVPNVLVFRLDGPVLASTEPVRTLELEPDTVPDGLALDADRNLYVSYYQPDQIAVVRPDGELEVVYRDYLAELLNRPTNVALQKNAIYFANLGGYHIGKIEHPLEALELVRP